MLHKHGVHWGSARLGFRGRGSGFCIGYGHSCGVLNVCTYVLMILVHVHVLFETPSEVWLHNWHLPQATFVDCTCMPSLMVW